MVQLYLDISISKYGVEKENKESRLSNPSSVALGRNTHYPHSSVVLFWGGQRRCARFFRLSSNLPKTIYANGKSFLGPYGKVYNTIPKIKIIKKRVPGHWSLIKL